MKIKLFNILDIFKKKKPDATLQTKFEELENIDPYISEKVISLEKYFPLLKEWDNCLIFNKSDEDNYNDLQFGVVKKGTYGT